jgi:hypothetical protein
MSPALPLNALATPVPQSLRGATSLKCRVVSLVVAEKTTFTVVVIPTGAEIGSVADNRGTFGHANSKAGSAVATAEPTA